VVSPKTGNDTVWISHALAGLKLNQYAIGQAQPGLSVGVLNSVAIHSPPGVAEQRRIADCLTSLDELIAAQSRKVEALRTYKQGLMQQLFPREGETVPRLRFPEFAGETLRCVELGSITEECKTRHEKSTKFLPVMGVSKSDGIVPMEERLIGKDLARYKKLEPEAFAYNPMRINIGSIARWKGSNDVLVSPDYVVFRCSARGKTGVSPAYLDCFRFSDQWNDFVAGSGDGGVRIRIYYKDLARLPLRLPSLAEQQRIADCLSSLDDMIAAQCQKLVSLKTHKAGLMQQLFPSAEDAVEGT
jgi:restriction endonuclease S subunit